MTVLEHQIFAPVGLVFNGLWAQLVDLQEQIGLITGAGMGMKKHGWALIRAMAL